MQRFIDLVEPLSVGVLMLAIKEEDTAPPGAGVVKDELLVHCSHPFFCSKVEVDQHQGNRQVEELQEIQHSHLKFGLSRDIGELQPCCSKFHDLLQRPVDKDHYYPIASIVIGNITCQVLRALTLILLLPSRHQLNDVEALAEAVVNELGFLFGLYILQLGVEILLGTVR